MHDRQQVTNNLTEDPLHHGTAFIDVSQFTCHLMETLDHIRYEVIHFETFTYSLIYCDSREYELHISSVSAKMGMVAEDDTLSNSRI